MSAATSLQVEDLRPLDLDQYLIIFGRRYRDLLQGVDFGSTSLLDLVGQSQSQSDTMGGAIESGRLTLMAFIVLGIWLDMALAGNTKG